MLRTRQLLGLLILSSIGGCAESVSEPDRPAISLAKGGAAGPSINGAVHYDTFGGLQTSAFHARILPDGSVHGTVELYSRGQELRFHGSVTCLQVTGNQALFGGFVTNSDVADGNDVTAFVSRIEDNGEGSGAVDRWTDIWIWLESHRVQPVDPCTHSAFQPPLFPIENGNVQVRN